MTAGFRISDGSVVWRDPGTIYACGQLPCPGQGGGGGAGSPTMGLRFQVAGTVRVSRSGRAPTLSPGGAVTLQGFDLATGKTLWSYMAGRDASVLQDMPTLLGSQVVALPTSGGHMVALNLATGKSRAVSPAAAGWCASSVQYKTPIGYSNGVGGTAYQRIANSGYEPCTASGAHVAMPQTVPGYAGIAADGLTVTSDSSEVAGTP